MDLGYKNGSSFPVDSSNGGKAGGLSMWWTDEVEATVMSSSLHHMDMKIENEAMGTRSFSGIYRWPEGRDKEQTWEMMRHLASQWKGPWLCGGDFNQFLSDEEKKGGNMAVEVDMQAFSDCMADTGLRNMGFTSYPSRGITGAELRVILRKDWIVS
ncbi:unnamed protein product [Linum trigynum]|uniref:Endonuclease/exonuclease/phosphatase domain-containing protein n=1 Tax=Linum trigynum TaxID=586398 RepID=A0AAV2F7C6_9ROSI